MIEDTLSDDFLASLAAAPPPPPPSPLARFLADCRLAAYIAVF